MALRLVVMAVFWGAVLAAVVSWAMGRRAGGSWRRSPQLTERDRMPDSVAGTWASGQEPPSPPPFG